MMQISNREKEILQLAANGLCNKEIAKELKISQRTVEAHLNNVANKLRTVSKTHSVALAIRSNLI